MASATYYLTGTARYAKVRENQLDVKYKKWSIDLNPDDESYQLFLDSGSRLKVKEDEEGNKWITFNRKKEMVKRDGEVVEFGPPVVAWGVDEPGDFNGHIGNGSKVTVKVEVYDSAAGKGTRLEGVRIEELVEYNPGEVLTPNDDVLPF